MKLENKVTAKRRTLLKGAAWAAPAIVATSAIPAYALSSSFEPLLTNLAIELADPPFNWDTFEPDYVIPIYDSATSRNVLERASFPPSFTVRNVGKVDAVNPTGTLLTQMRDIGTDVPSAGGANGTKIASTNPLIGITRTGSDKFNAATFTWAYAGVLKPGEEFTFEFKYHVNYPFWNVDYELFVAATVNDQTEGDYDDNSERMGTVPHFLDPWPW
ncbi:MULTISPECIES: hypothetical protein [unclassified Rothia (in: high G+C Gram-positive bacteria)]|uniref:hypothetical protein n=1 Tax=unclassified Rothia (in: high G+C Gram-positive bacteria) TaxID=2689056 RepID=UPI0019580724|nr:MULTISPECIES: hypothetical protein [unclassified Rothia (in: high G+C Gram-positive bacteria)]MBM7051230.1 hypothetical protein [Rothia sp. ZJ1223]QRZ62076.1 hypothetical protein JR346_02880 [Rothia sp. ZJ932]